MNNKVPSAGNCKMFRRHYKPQAKEKREFGVLGRPLQSKRDSGPKWSVDPDFVDDDGRTHVHIGVLKYCVDDTLFEASLKAGCNVETVDKQGYTALHYAAEKGLVTCVDKLIKHGASVNTFTNEDFTPLMLASCHGHPAAVKSLAKASVNINLTNKKGELALHFCCGNGHRECAEILLKHKAKVNYPDNEGNTPLTLACRSAKTGVVEALIEKGAKVDKVEESSGRTPLHLAVLAGNLDMVRILLDQDPYLDVMDKRYSTPFMYAVNTNKPAILRMLIAAGCDRSSIDGLNGTAMSLAALKGYKECVQALLDAGDDPDEFSYFGMTALMSAVYESRYEVAKVLLEGGADPTIISRSGFSAMFANLCHMKSHNAALRHRQAVLLLKYGADVNYRINSASIFTAITNGKNCPMSFAITSGYVSMVKLFLYAGSDIKTSEINDLIIKQDTASFYELNSILAPIKEYRSQPVPLVHHCRLQIRKELGTKVVEKIAALPIAPPLKDYLNFNDLMTIEPEYAATTNKVSEYMMTFINVKTCGLASLKGSFLFEMVNDSVLQAQGPGPCDCDTCRRIRSM